jgi:hypothetical protein
MDDVNFRNCCTNRSISIFSAQFHCPLEFYHIQILESTITGIFAFRFLYHLLMVCYVHIIYY